MAIHDFFKGGTGSTCTECGEVFTVFTDWYEHVEHVKKRHSDPNWKPPENLGVYTSRSNPDGTLTVTRRHDGKIEEQTIQAGESAWGIKYYGVNPDPNEGNEDERPQLGVAFFH